MPDSQVPGRFVWLVVGPIIWFCLAYAVGAAGTLRSVPAQTIPVIVALLTVIVLLSCWRVPTARSVVMSLDFRYILGFHLIRFVAALFLLIEAGNGKLAAAFAYPAAIGDMVVALFALLLLGIVTRPSGRLLLVIWNTAGLVDILFVVSSALRVGLRDWTGMIPLRELPLSLLPTFVVPLIIASHIIIFVRLVRRRT